MLLRNNILSQWHDLSRAERPSGKIGARPSTARDRARRTMQMHKLLTASLIAILAAATASAQQQHGILVRPAAIHVNPDLSAAKLDSAQRGREVVIINRSRDWLQVLVDLGE